MADQRFDVCIVGAGVAGIACAQGLARQGASVLLLERLHPMPDVLKAEKLDGEGPQALLRLGFHSAVEAAMTPLHNVSVFFGERSLGTVPLDPPEAGALYHDLINSLRANLDQRVDFRPGTKATGFEQQGDVVSVVTSGDGRFACRLVVISTGDAHQLVESLGGSYEPQMPQRCFAVAFTAQGRLGEASAPVDAATYHHPIPGSPIAYAAVFRLGDALRVNVFCPGEVSEDWQRDLKQHPLETLARGNRLLATATRSWQITSPVALRKVHVTKLRAPAIPRIVVLGDAAHTIDPSGGGGLSFALLEAELLLGVYVPRWQAEDDYSPAAIQSFYDDPRRLAAIKTFFDRGRYIFALNHDTSPKGKLRRLQFAWRHRLTSGKAIRRVSRAASADPAWQVPARYLYEQYDTSGSRRNFLTRF